MLELALFLLVQCPMVGFAVVIGGHVVGNMIEGREGGNIGMLHKYGLLIGLGFVTQMIHTAVSGGM